jgi:hypothetical protein
MIAHGFVCGPSRGPHTVGIAVVYDLPGERPRSPDSVNTNN